MNELLIKPDCLDLTEEKEEEDVVEESVEEEHGSRADCVFTASNLETALSQVITCIILFKYMVITTVGGDAGGKAMNSPIFLFLVSSTTDK